MGMPNRVGTIVYGNGRFGTVLYIYGGLGWLCKGSQAGLGIVELGNDRKFNMVWNVGCGGNRV